MVSTPQVYMLPLGGGVSKAGGNHKWSNGESRAQPLRTRATPAAASRPAPHLSRRCCGAQTSGAAWARASRPSRGCAAFTRSARGREAGRRGDGTRVAQRPRRPRAGQRVRWPPRRRARQNCTYCVGAFRACGAHVAACRAPGGRLARRPALGHTTRVRLHVRAADGAARHGLPHARVSARAWLGGGCRGGGGAGG